MEDLVYACRAHAFAAERTFQLGPAEMTVSQKNAASRQIPLNDVTQVALASMGGEGAPVNCRVKTRSQGNLSIWSHHVGSQGSYDAQHATFDPFVQALCLRVSEQNPTAKFVRGSRLYLSLWLVGFVAATAFTIAMLVGFLHDLLAGGAINAELLLGLVIGAAIAFKTGGAALANRGVTFSPAAPPLPR